MKDLMLSIIHNRNNLDTQTTKTCRGWVLMNTVKFVMLWCTSQFIEKRKVTLDYRCSFILLLHLTLKGVYSIRPS